MYEMIPIEIAASGMSAQRVRMGLVASNLANALTTRRADGTVAPYQRRMAEFQAARLPMFEAQLNREMDRGALGDGGVRLEPKRSTWLAEAHLRGVRVSDVVKDTSEPLLKYDPKHPDANPEGYVAYPNINVFEEYTDMIMASRLYEGNLAVIKNTRDMISQLLELLRT